MPAANTREFSPGEIAVIQALIPGRQRWSELEKETGLTPRWLGVSLHNLEKKKATQREVEDLGASQSVHYKLQEGFRREYAPMLEVLSSLRSRIEQRHFDLDSIEGLIDAAASAPLLYTLCSLVAADYRQNDLFRFLKSQALRQFDKIIEAGRRIPSRSVRAHFKSEYGMDLERMTFEQFTPQQIKLLLDTVEQSLTG